MEKHNPLTQPYPKFDKALALFRKGMIINDTSDLGIDIFFYSFSMVEFRIYQCKDVDKQRSIFAEMVDFNSSQAATSMQTVGYVFNNILKKGTFPKSIPSFKLKK